MRFPDDGPVFYVGLAARRLRARPLHRRLPWSPAPPARMLLSIEVADVDACLPGSTASAVRCRAPANDMPWGQRVAHIKDPDGNVVNLTQTDLSRVPAAVPVLGRPPTGGPMTEQRPDTDDARTRRHAVVRTVT